MTGTGRVVTVRFTAIVLHGPQQPAMETRFLGILRYGFNLLQE